jgi:integrase
MSRNASGIPSYRRHRASGQAVVTLNRVDHYLGPWNSAESKSRYDKVVNEWLARGRRLSDRTGADSVLLMKELILGYYGHIVATIPEEVDRIKLALKPVREMYGELPAAKFGPVAFQAVRTKLVDSGLCVSTVRMRLGVIKRMVGWGVANEMLPGDALYRLQAVAPLKAGQAGARPPKKVPPVPEEHIQAVLPHLQPAVRTMVELQALTGMRPGEVCRMTTGQIDRSGDLWLYQPTRHKTANRGKDRVIPLGPRAQEVLKPWLKADPDAPLFSPREASDQNDQIRQRPTRTPRQRAARRMKHPRRRFRETYGKGSYATAIERGCVRADIPVFRPNRIRHTYTTRIRREYGLEAVQVLLGHSKADVTQIYAERDMSLARDVAAKIG